MDKDKIIEEILNESINFQEEVKNRILENKYANRTTLTFDKRVLDKLSIICKLENVSKKDYLEILIEKIYKNYICSKEGCEKIK